MSNIRYYNTHRLHFHDMFIFSLSRFLHNNSGFLQNNKQWFICSVRSSRTLIQTHRVILMLCVWMKHKNHSTGIPHFPVPTPTSFHCFLCLCMQTTSLCVQLPHADIVVIATSRVLSHNQALDCTRINDRGINWQIKFSCVCPAAFHLSMVPEHLASTVNVKVKLIISVSHLSFWLFKLQLMQVSGV